MVAVDLGSICGPDVATWICFKCFLVAPPWQFLAWKYLWTPNACIGFDSSIGSHPLAAKFLLAPRMTYVENSFARTCRRPILAAGGWHP